MDFGQSRSPPLTLRTTEQLSSGTSMAATQSTATMTLHHHQQRYDGHASVPSMQSLNTPDADGTTNILLRTMESVYNGSMTAEDEKQKSLRDKIRLEKHNHRLCNDVDKLTSQVQEEKNRRMSESTVRREGGAHALHHATSNNSGMRIACSSPCVSLAVRQLTADLASNTILMQQIVTDQSDFKVRAQSSACATCHVLQLPPSAPHAEAL
jgi:hypothetical protein